MLALLSLLALLRLLRIGLLLLGAFAALQLLNLALQLFGLAPKHFLFPTLPERLLLFLLLLRELLLPLRQLF